MDEGGANMVHCVHVVHSVHIVSGSSKRVQGKGRVKYGRKQKSPRN
ncbi:MAG: hypothetical protein HGB01_11885 [Chlorobiaceae bacterium]|nr:hypothetical protein [Chlorobiaceae bacterium]